MSAADAAAVTARFGLEPLPVEGGYVRRYWPSPDATPPQPGSAILFLVTDAPEGRSRFHRLTKVDQGFEPAGLRPGYYTDNNEDALIMWAELGNMKAGERS